MKIATAYAIASYVKEPAPDRILPDPLDREVAQAVGAKVAEMERKCECVRKELDRRKILFSKEGLAK